MVLISLVSWKGAPKTLTVGIRMDEQLMDYSIDSLTAEDIWVNFSRPNTAMTESVAASLSVTRVEVVTMQMEDMEVTTQNL